MPSRIRTTETFKKVIKKPLLSVVHFYADWMEQSEQVDQFLNVLSKNDEYSNVKFYTVWAESNPEITKEYDVTVVPTVLLFKNGEVIDRSQGADVRKLSEIIKQNIGECPKDEAVLQDLPLDEHLKDLINSAPIMLFMKGNKSSPQCGFSRQMVELLQKLNVEYKTFDILTDEEVRQGLKTYSNWPTYPQLYVKGELIGGLDIVKDLLATGELEATLKGC